MMSFIVLLPVLSLGICPAQSPQEDWLVTRPVEASRLDIQAADHEITLTNGLVARSFRIDPNAATVDLVDLASGMRFLRAVKPEALLTIDGKAFPIGGLAGQPDLAYLDPAWLEDMTAPPGAFQFTGYEAGKPEAPYPWEPQRHAPDAPWPPKGVHLTLAFAPPQEMAAQYAGLEVCVHYEIYDGLPVIAKWVSVKNNSSQKVAIDACAAEIIAAPEDAKPRLHAESNYAFNTMVTTYWETDPAYTSQTDYEYQSPILMTSKYPMGPGVELAPGESFDSFRTYVLLLDSDSRERRGLARRRMMRILAPQVTENPIFMHVRQSDSLSIRRAVDQCAETGFEMVILTFGSGFDIESQDPEYIARFKADVDYAHNKGIEVGGYTLMCASRDVGAEDDCISAETGQPGSMFGQSACLASAWAEGYFARVLNFMDATGMDMIETDGPFHGDKCASGKHPGHRGLEDSQLRQWEQCCWFYHECRKRGIFINSPDLYYLNGSNKCGMGYRETNFSLPRWRQIHIARQNIFDGTFEKTPTMGWMFVPLVEYHGGGAAATMEPLSQHLLEYEWHLAQNFACGVQACYRGPRLYDTAAVRDTVKKWVDFYKSHRAILDSDLIHLRRADGRRIDGVLHVNPGLEERGLAVFFNPTDTELTETYALPLYYTGLTKKARIREQEGRSKTYKLDRAYDTRLPVTLGPKGITWFVIEPGK